MTQKQFDSAMNVLLPILVFLVIVLLIISVIYGVIMITNRAGQNIVSEQMTVEETKADESDTTTIEIHTEPTLEEKYISVFEWQIYTGDFGIDQLYYLKSQCDKYEIPMEIMLSIICTESSFRSTAKASTSSAAGYCQIIKGTAQWVYEDLLKYGEYDIDNHIETMTTNWKLNIELACRLMYCLYWNANQSWEVAIQNYHGGSTDANLTYLNRVNTNMKELFSMTISDI